MAATLYRRLFPNEPNHITGLHNQLKSIMPKQGRVLDLGCGQNQELAGYRSAEREVWGADFQAHSHLQHPEWFRLLENDGKIPFPDESFDLVVTVMVMEHVADPQAFLREIARVLKPNGRFIGHSISGSHYVTWIRRAIGVLPHSFNQWLVRKLYQRAEEDTFPAHYRLNNRGQMVKACQQAGLNEPQLTRYADPGYFRFSRILFATATLTDWLLDKIRGGWGRLYFTMATQKGTAKSG